LASFFHGKAEAATAAATATTAGIRERGWDSICWEKHGEGKIGKGGGIGKRIRGKGEMGNGEREIMHISYLVTTGRGTHRKRSARETLPKFIQMHI
jgi:hypothetical protein